MAGDLSDGARLFPRTHPIRYLRVAPTRCMCSEVLAGSNAGSAVVVFLSAWGCGGGDRRLKTKVKSARLLKTGQNVPLTQDEPFSLHLKGAAGRSAGLPIVSVEVKCEGEPIVDAWGMVSLCSRYKVGIS